MLKELDPKAYEQLEAFHDLVREQYGDILTAWIKCFEPQCTGQVELPFFEKRLEQMGYKACPPAQLVKALCPSDDQGYLFLRDLDKEAAKQLTVRYKKMCEAKRAAARAGKDVGAKTKAEFLTLLQRKYG